MWIVTYGGRKTGENCHRCRGAALAGTLQTENIGIEKIVANIASNPNIRHKYDWGRRS